MLRQSAVAVAVAITTLSLVAGPAGAQEPGDEDVPTVLPTVPREATDRLPEPGDLQQRHPWVPNDAPWPWNMSIAQGSWQNSNSSITTIYCGPTVASQNPYWWQENLRYTQFTGGARCNVQMRAITGIARLYQWNGPNGAGAQLASATIGSQHAVPPGHGSGWQAYAEGYYNRTSDAQNLQIHLSVTLEIQPWGTGARWNTVPNSCTRDANIRIIHCELWSVPFRFAPYSCPSPRVGLQPLCNGVPGVPQPCPPPSVGILPNCVLTPGQNVPANTSRPVISGTPAEGQILTASPGSWSNAPMGYLYQWQQCDVDGVTCSDVDGADDSRYLVTTVDRGLRLRVRVTAFNPNGVSAAANSSATAVVASELVPDPSTEGVDDPYYGATKPLDAAQESGGLKDAYPEEPDLEIANASLVFACWVGDGGTRSEIYATTRGLVETDPDRYVITGRGWSECRGKPPKGLVRIYRACVQRYVAAQAKWKDYGKCSYKKVGHAARVNFKDSANCDGKVSKWRLKVRLSMASKETNPATTSAAGDGTFHDCTSE
jgi:hypothetical protein